MTQFVLKRLSDVYLLIKALSHSLNIYKRVNVGFSFLQSPLPLSVATLDPPKSPLEFNTRARSPWRVQGVQLQWTHAGFIENLR